MDNLEYILGLIDSSIGTLGGGLAIDHIPYSAEIGISASGTKTVYVIDDIVTADINFTLVNPGEQSIGDQLFVMSKPDSTGGNITYTDVNRMNPQSFPYDDGYVVHTFLSNGTLYVPSAFPLPQLLLTALIEEIIPELKQHSPDFFGCRHQGHD